MRRHRRVILALVLSYFGLGGTRRENLLAFGGCQCVGALARCLRPRRCRCRTVGGRVAFAAPFHRAARHARLRLDCCKLSPRFGGCQGHIDIGTDRRINPPGCYI